MPLDLSAPISEWLPTVWYGGYLDGLPDLCVGRLPAAFGRSSPWKIWIVERPEERTALLRSLALPVPPAASGAVDLRAGPDAAVNRPGSGDPFLALYVPTEDGWPWITLGRFDSEVGRKIGLNRGVYSTETDDTERAAVERLARLKRLAPGAPVLVPDHLRTGN